MNQNTLLFRQINENWIRGEHITSLAFRPSKKDNKKLSVYDGDQITAFASWQHYTQEQGLKSAGVMAVSVGECDSLNLPVTPDSASFREHVVIEFGNCSRSQIETNAKKLRNLAELRSWQYKAK